jgi:hypothetical protein
MCLIRRQAGAWRYDSSIQSNSKLQFGEDVKGKGCASSAAKQEFGGTI